MVTSVKRGRRVHDPHTLHLVRKFPILVVFTLVELLIAGHSLPNPPMHWCSSGPPQALLFSRISESWMFLTSIDCWTFLTKSSQALIFISHVPRLCKLPKWFPQGFLSGSLIPLSIPYQFLAFLESSSPKLCFLSGLFTTSFPALLSWRVPLWSFDFCNSYVSLGTSNTILPCFDFLKDLINPPMPSFDLLQDSSRNPKE